jgi:hypothetical protein
MKINESLTYDGASVEDVYAIITDESFRNETCTDQGATEYDVTIEPNDLGGDTVTIVRTMPADMPDFIKKLTGQTVTAKQVETWSGPDDGGNRKADVHLNIVGQPAEMKGTVEVVGNGSNTSFVFDGDVKVSIPFIGKKIEPEIAKSILKSIRAEVALGNTKI